MLVLADFRQELLEDPGLILFGVCPERILGFRVAPDDNHPDQVDVVLVGVALHIDVDPNWALREFRSPEDVDRLVPYGHRLKRMVVLPRTRSLPRPLASGPERVRQLG